MAALGQGSGVGERRAGSSPRPKGRGKSLTQEALCVEGLMEMEDFDLI